MSKKDIVIWAEPSARGFQKLNIAAHPVSVIIHDNAHQGAPRDPDAVIADTIAMLNDCLIDLRINQTK